MTRSHKVKGMNDMLDDLIEDYYKSKDSYILFKIDYYLKLCDRYHMTDDEIPYLSKMRKIVKHLDSY